MKFVVNHAFGGFSLPEDFCEKYGYEKYSYIARTDPRLIDYVESHGGSVKDDWVSLGVVEIPDDATDYEIYDYDGMESIIYVIDGKLYHV